MSDEIGAMAGDSDNPNPEEFKVAMRTARAGEVMRHDDYVGSYNHTGRVKLEKKKWTPSKPDAGDNAFRADDWMGSGQTTSRKSWKPKSSTNTVQADEASKPGEFVRSSSEQVRKWHPPPKDSAPPPPWMGSPTVGSPRREWKPKSPMPQPENASNDQSKEDSEPGEMDPSDLHDGGDDSKATDVAGLSGSMNHISLTSSPEVTTENGWQSHGGEMHHSTHTKEVDADDSSEEENYEVPSDDEAENPVATKPEEDEKPAAVKSAASAAPAEPAVGYVVEDDDDKPNPDEYKVAMRTARAGEVMRHDDYVGSYNHTGRVKLEKKKWTPSKPDAGDNAFRADDWMGSGKTTSRKSWKPKSSTNTVRADEASKPGEFVRSSSEKVRKWQPPPKDSAPPPPGVGSPTVSSPRREWKPKSPTPKPENAGSHHSNERSEHSDHSSSNHGEEEDESKEIAPIKVDEDEDYESASGGEAEASEATREAKETSPAAGPAATTPAAAPAPAVGYVVEDDDDKPNPEEFKVAMRTARAGEVMRHDDYVGSYNHTGRVKLDKKKWTPSKPDEGDNAFRSDDWMGSGKTTTRKSWKVKK